MFNVFISDKMGLESGLVGLLMVYLFQLFDLFQWAVVLTTYVENLMTSVERIVEYTEIPGEPLNEEKEKPPKDWPDKGEIKFDDVCLSYDPNLPPVLKNLSLNIKSNEKIGIVGRTGIFSFITERKINFGLTYGKTLRRWQIFFLPGNI